MGIIGNNSFKKPKPSNNCTLADRLFSVKEPADSTQLPTFQETLRTINPFADILSFQANEPLWLVTFQLNKFTATLTEHEMTHSPHEHAHEHHHHTFHSLTLTASSALNEPLFTRWLDWLMYTHQEKLYRFKGILALQEHDFTIAMQGVNQQVLSNDESTPQETTIVLIGKELETKNSRNLSNPQQNSYSVNYFLRNGGPIYNGKN